MWIIGSSATIHNLFAGQFEADIGLNYKYTRLLAYYPLALYDFRVTVIPDFSKRYYFPPLMLKRKGNVDGYFRFMPGTLNIDTKEQNFAVSNVKIYTQIPEFSFGFSVNFDILSNLQNELLSTGVRFNVFEISIDWIVNGIDTSLIRLSLDLIYTQKNTIEINNQERLEGTLDVIINISIDKVDYAEQKRTYNILYSPNSEKDLPLADSDIYSGSVPFYEKLIALLSPQTMIVTVRNLKGFCNTKDIC